MVGNWGSEGERKLAKVPTAEEGQPRIHNQEAAPPPPAAWSPNLSSFIISLIRTCVFLSSDANNSTSECLWIATQNDIGVLEDFVF